jgi:hypothetical protein
MVTYKGKKESKNKERITAENVEYCSNAQSG